MKKWHTYKLGDMIETQKGYAFKSKWYTNQGWPIVKVSNFTMDSIDITSLAYIPEETARDYLQFELRVNDIVIQTVGSWPTNPASVVGKVIKVPSSASGALLNQNAVILKTKPLVDNKFLFYALRSSKFKNYIINTAQGAANQASITLESIRNYSTLLPDMNTQRRIASVLSAYDDLIENNTRRIAILEEMARLIYQEWFVHFRFPGHEKVKMVESELGPIPEGWEATRLEDLAIDIRDSVEPSEVPTDTPYVGLEHIPRRSITLKEWGMADAVASMKLRFRPNHILFGKIRPYFHKVSIAPISGICSSDVIVIQAKKSEWLMLVLACVSHDEFVEHATQTSNGTKMPRANWNVLLKYPLPLPPVALLEKFNAIMENFILLARNLMLKNQNLRTQRDLLLPKLISGEIDVSDIPKMESAAA